MPRLPFTAASMSEMETEIIVSHVLAPATIQSHGHLQCKGNLIRGCRRSAAVSSHSEPEGLRAGGDLAGPTTRPRPRGECKGWVWRHHSRSADYSDRVGGGQEAPGVGRRESGGRGGSTDTDGFHGTACAGNGPRTRLVPHRAPALSVQRARSAQGCSEVCLFFWL